MNSHIYEFLLRGTPDGTLSGGHVIFFDATGREGSPQPIGATPDAITWPHVAGLLNAAALAAVETLTAQVATLQAAATEAAEQLATARAEAATALATAQAEAATALAEAQAEITRLTPPPQATSITPRQLRLYLLSIGRLEAVQALISSQGETALIEWEFSLEIHRAHPLTEAIGQLLGLTAADLDTAFQTASAL